MTKAPFVLDHTTKNCPPEGVNDPSRSAGGRKAAEHSGQRTRRSPLTTATRSPFSLPFNRSKVGVRTSQTTAAERLSSTPHINHNPGLLPWRLGERSQTA